MAAGAEIASGIWPFNLYFADTRIESVLQFNGYKRTAQFIHAYPAMQNLEQLPWKFYPRDGRRDTAKKIVNSVKPTRIEFQHLSAKHTDSARPNTLSAHHGNSQFPLHTDRALDGDPPRWIVLVAPRPRDAKTILFDKNLLINIFGYDFLFKSIFIKKSKNIVVKEFEKI